ncbi:hypothetical protein [Hymenobacter nivis]|nr:hypothetical protein [Hymenobacter nivis]
MRILSLLLLVLGLASFAPGPKLITAKLPGLTVGVPEGFAPLPDDGIAAKYPAARKPLAVYSSPNGRADYSVAVRPTDFQTPDYNVLLQIYKASIQRLYSKVDFIKQEVRQVHGHDFVSFEFVTTVVDARRGDQLAPIRKYQAVQYTVVKDQMYVFTFDAPAAEQAQWQPVAQAVMGAINLK